MKAKVEKPFVGARDGELHPEHFPAGSVVTGDLAAVAVREGWAVPLEDGPQDSRKKAKRPDNKALPAAPENKAG